MRLTLAQPSICSHGAYGSPAVSLPDVPHACARQRHLLLVHISYLSTPDLLRAIEPAGVLSGEHAEVLCAFLNVV
jgi:hypothetical protein